MALPIHNCIRRAALHQVLLHFKRVLAPRVFKMAMEPGQVSYRRSISPSYHPFLRLILLRMADTMMSAAPPSDASYVS